MRGTFTSCALVGWRAAGCTRVRRRIAGGLRAGWSAATRAGWNAEDGGGTSRRHAASNALRPPSTFTSRFLTKTRLSALEHVRKRAVNLLMSKNALESAGRMASRRGQQTARRCAPQQTAQHGVLRQTSRRGALQQAARIRVPFSNRTVPFCLKSCEKTGSGCCVRDPRVAAQGAQARAAERHAAATRNRARLPPRPHPRRSTSNTVASASGG